MIKNGNDLEKFEFDGKSKVLLIEHRSRIVLLELRKPKEKHIFWKYKKYPLFEIPIFEISIICALTWTTVRFIQFESK